MTASILCASLLDGPRQPLCVAHRSRGAYQLADRHGMVRVCLADTSAIRLPHALTVRRLPPPPDSVDVGGGCLRWGATTYRVARWWLPARPSVPGLHRGLHERAAVDLRTRWAAMDLRTRWQRRLGHGDGLTPYGDDVVCGALIALHATGEPAAVAVSHEVAAAPLERHTTATSAALLRFAAAGWCIDAVAEYLTALASGHDLGAARAALLAVGSSSGRGLLEGIDMVCGAEPAAAA